MDKLIEIIKSGTDPQVRRRPSRRSPAGRTTPRHEAAARAGGKAKPPDAVPRDYTLTLAGISAAAASLGAQTSLRARVESGGDARVQFRYAARADVCGLGSSIQIGTSTWINTGNSNVWNGADRPPAGGDRWWCGSPVPEAWSSTSTPKSRRNRRRKGSPTSAWCRPRPRRSTCSTSRPAQKDGQAGRRFSPRPLPTAPVSGRPHRDRQERRALPLGAAKRDELAGTGARSHRR